MNIYGTRLKNLRLINFKIRRFAAKIICLPNKHFILNSLVGNFNYRVIENNFNKYDYYILNAMSIDKKAQFEYQLRALQDEIVNLRKKLTNSKVSTEKGNLLIIFYSNSSFKSLHVQ